MDRSSHKPQLDYQLLIEQIQSGIIGVPLHSRQSAGSDAADRITLPYGELSENTSAQPYLEVEDSSSVLGSEPYEGVLFLDTTDKVADYTAAAASKMVEAAGIVVESFPATEEGDAAAIKLSARLNKALDQKAVAVKRVYNQTTERGNLVRKPRVETEAFYRRNAEDNVRRTREAGGQILKIVAPSGSTDPFYRELEKIQAARRAKQTER